MDIIHQLQAWAEEEPTIRALVLLGSRARDGAIDNFSDYDVLLLVDDEQELLGRETEWKQRFGPILVEIPEMATLPGGSYPTRLLLYRDGTKIDFSLCPAPLLEKALQDAEPPGWLTVPYQMLLDKADWGRRLEAFRRQYKTEDKPDAATYGKVVNEFFWEITYIAKQLYRGEIWLALYSEGVVREQLLLPMLEWSEKARHDWKYDTAYQGRYIRHWLHQERYELLLATCSGADPADKWRALAALIRLFRETAREVATALGYVYPAKLDAGVMAYLRERVGDRLPSATTA